jgi:dihydroorotase-like cyclic amidohydrolase
LTIDALVKLTATKPAEIFRLKGKGCIEQGKNADLVAIDLKASFMIDASEFHSKAKFSPFNGWQVQGKPVKTFVNGNLAMENGEIVTKSGSGRVIRREIP